MEQIHHKMKKSIKIFAGIIFVGAIVMACDKFNDTTGLSDADIIDGLKTALKVGTDSAVKITSATDGYYKDALIKIALPPEAKVITDNIASIDKYSSDLGIDVNLSNYAENVVHSMNKAAEYAADSAKPILINSITSLSISDGLSILNGTNPAASGKKSASGFDSTAATHYLKSTTYNDLVRAYKAPIDGELNKDLGLGFSSNDAWSTLTAAYNQVANSASSVLATDNIVPFLSSDERNALKAITPIQNTTLGQYVTEKALDGLFLKVGDQERSIRKDPLKWASDVVGGILEKVFGK